MSNENKIERIRAEVCSYGYEFVDYHIKTFDCGARGTFVSVVDELGYKYEVRIEELKHKRRQRNFIDNRNPFSLENLPLWLIHNNKSFYLCDGNIYADSKTKLKFHCRVCDEDFYMNWGNLQTGQGCAVCRGYQIGSKTSLAHLRPDLAEEWSNRNELSSDEITVNSGKRMWWICKTCKYEWKAAVCSRSRGQGCPACSNPPKVVTDRNRLSLLYPELIKEWHPIKNELNPQELSIGSHKKVWWLCSVCENEWEMIVKDRARGRGCPRCAFEQTESKVATAVKDYCVETYSGIPEYPELKNPDTGHSLPYDVFIPDYIYVEVNGHHHYKFNTLYHRTKEDFEYRQHLDSLKRQHAESHGHFIEIDIRKHNTPEKGIIYLEKELQKLGISKFS